VDAKLGGLNIANALHSFSDQYGWPTCARRQKFSFAHVICWQSFPGLNTDVCHWYSKFSTVVDFLSDCDFGVQNSEYFMFVLVLIVWVFQWPLCSETIVPVLNES